MALEYDNQQINQTLAAITVPTLILDEPRCKRNIARMAEKARKSGARFRPHFKTHQSHMVGRWFREAGVTAITTSSLRMAEYFADDGWDDITVAFPVNVREIDRINTLASRIRLGLLVESVESAAFLAQHVTTAADIWLEADTGYGRTGVGWHQPELAVKIAQTIAASPLLTLRGLLSHAGNAYAARDQDTIEKTHAETVSRLAGLRDALTGAGFSELAISSGDTPTCSAVENLSGVDEIRPGNFVYYDMMQVMIGACTLDDLVVAAACPVVSIQPDKGRIIVYGGVVHLSRDTYIDAQGRTSHGAVVLWTGDGWLPVVDSAYVASLSQEHGIIHADAEVIERVKVGDLVFVLPAHSCTTADLLKGGVTLTGEPFSMMTYT